MIVGLVVLLFGKCEILRFDLWLILMILPHKEKQLFVIYKHNIWNECYIRWQNIP